MTAPDQPLHATRALCPGSYDPFTLGHLDVVERCAAMFDSVVVAVLHNPDKAGLFTGEERVDLIEKSLEHLSNVTVVAHAGELLVDVARQHAVTAIVKGIRSQTDYAYELPMAQMNRHLTGLETLFLPCSQGLEHLSSSLIKQVAAMGGDTSRMLPDVVQAALTRRLGTEQ